MYRMFQESPLYQFTWIGSRETRWVMSQLKNHTSMKGCSCVRPSPLLLLNKYICWKAMGCPLCWPYFWNTVPPIFFSHYRASNVQYVNILYMQTLLTSVSTQRRLGGIIGYFLCCNCMAFENSKHFQSKSHHRKKATVSGSVLAVGVSYLL